jgi:hypothetical protein
VLGTATARDEHLRPPTGLVRGASLDSRRSEFDLEQVTPGPAAPSQIA